MTFKAATCPGCGGDLQIQSGQAVVKCLYCGVDVMVREGAEAADMRVQEVTAARPVKPAPEVLRFAKVLVGCGALAVSVGIGLMALTSDITYGAIMMVVGMVLLMTGIVNL